MLLSVLQPVAKAVGSSVHLQANNWESFAFELVCLCCLNPSHSGYGATLFHECALQVSAFTGGEAAVAVEFTCTCMRIHGRC